MSTKISVDVYGEKCSWKMSEVDQKLTCWSFLVTTSMDFLDNTELLITCVDFPGTPLHTPCMNMFTEPPMKVSVETTPYIREKQTGIVVGSTYHHGKALMVRVCLPALPRSDFAATPPQTASICDIYRNVTFRGGTAVAPTNICNSTIPRNNRIQYATVTQIYDIAAPFPPRIPAVLRPALQGILRGMYAPLRRTYRLLLHEFGNRTCALRFGASLSGRTSLLRAPAPQRPGTSGSALGWHAG